MVKNNGVKTFNCAQCGKKFSDKQILDIHLRIHTGEKPFSCSQCDYKCTQLGHLKRHKRIHTGDKPFNCSQCDYKCSEQSALKRHQRIHTGETIQMFQVWLHMCKIKSFEETWKDSQRNFRLPEFFPSWNQNWGSLRNISNIKFL